MAFGGIAKDTAIYGSADLIGKLIAFITFPIIASVFSPSDYGILELAMTVIGLFGICIGCGLSNAVQRFYWEQNISSSNKAALVSSGFSVQIILGMGFVIVASLGVFFLKSNSNVFDLSSIPVTTITLFALILLAPASQWLQFIQDTTRLLFMPLHFVLLSVLTKISAAILAILAVIVYEKGIDGFILTQACVVIAVLPIGLFVIRSHLTLRLKRQYCYDLFKFGYPFIFVGMAYWLFGSMDRWMLAYMSSLEDTGLYSIANRFAALVMFISTAFALAWSPHSMKLVMHNRESYPKICGIVLTYLVFFMLIFGGGLALFSGELIGITMPEIYGPASYSLIILCLGVIFQSTTQITAVGISLSKKTWIFARLIWITTLVNFIGNWLLIEKLGAVGASISTALSYSVLAFLYGFYTQRLEPIIIYWWRLLWLSVLGATIFLVSVTFSSTELGWVTFNKFLFATCILCLGIFALPIKETKSLILK